MTTAIAIRDPALAGSNTTAPKGSGAYWLQRLYIRRTIATYSCVECGTKFEATMPQRGQPERGLCPPCEARTFLTRFFSGSPRTRTFVLPRQPVTAEVIAL